VSLKTALAVALKVDVEALPRSVVRALQCGKLNLDDPAVTLDLLRAGAVLGVTGFAFVANLEMHGKGTFYDPRLDHASRFPIAARVISRRRVRQMIATERPHCMGCGRMLGAGSITTGALRRSPM
jgi:hypothetical protein